MKMVRADLASSGVMFTLDTESGFRDVVFVTGVYGLGENIVQGTVDPDEFYVHKPTFQAGHRVVLNRSLGDKHLRMVYARAGGGTKNVVVPKAQRERFCLTDSEVLKLAGDAIGIESHYSRNAGRPMPMDIEWAKDGNDGQIYIIQARPETVISQRALDFTRKLRVGTHRAGAGGRPRGRRKNRRWKSTNDRQYKALKKLQGRGSPRRRINDTGLGAGYEDRRRNRDRAWRTNLSCSDCRARTRHPCRGGSDRRQETG